MKILFQKNMGIYFHIYIFFTTVQSIYKCKRIILNVILLFYIYNEYFKTFKICITKLILKVIIIYTLKINYFY